MFSTRMLRIRKPILADSDGSLPLTLKSLLDKEIVLTIIGDRQIDPNERRDVDEKRALSMIHDILDQSEQRHGAVALRFTRLVHGAVSWPAVCKCFDFRTNGCVNSSTDGVTNSGLTSKGR